jgi:protein-disulfide isomerase
VHDPRIQRSDISPDDWSLGSDDAAVTIVEYVDFECPHCAVTTPVVEAIARALPDAVRLVLRHFPVSSTHPHATLAAEAAEAAGEQGHFWPMVDLLFKYQRQLEYDYLRIYAQRVGCDLGQFDEDMEAHRYLDEVRRDFRRGINDGVNGTPTLYINRHRYDGPRDRSSLLTVIASLSGVEPHAAH